MRNCSLFEVALIFCLFSALAEAFYDSTGHFKVSGRGKLFSSKTPLVANGKRFEAEPGSSLLAVRALIASLNTVPLH